MKPFAALLFTAALVAGCQNESKLDSSGGNLEARVKKLEEQNAKYEKALEWVNGIYAQQQQQARAREESEPDPSAMFAVDIKPNIDAGLYEGPAAGAPVTIVEAWDFA